MRRAATPPSLELTLEDLAALLARLRPTAQRRRLSRLEALVETLSVPHGACSTIRRSRLSTCDSCSGAAPRRRRVACSPERAWPRRRTAAAPARRPPPGHGRIGAAAYAGARRSWSPTGAPCTPAIPVRRVARGRCTSHRDPRRLVRIVGQAPLAATVYALEKLRCNLCAERLRGGPAPRRRLGKV